MVVDTATKKLYYLHVVGTFALRDGVEYDSNHVFANNQLQSLTPKDIVRYLCSKVYGNPDPPEGSFPTEGRSSSLEYYKKSISYFMPNKRNNWDDVVQRGNPTRSGPVNDLIAEVKKHEVRKQGKASCAKRPIEKEEFDAVIDFFRTKDVVYRSARGRSIFDSAKYSLAAFYLWQYHLITRIDDAANTGKVSLLPCSTHMFDSFALTAHLFWSKNIYEERDAPHQILFASIEPSMLFKLTTKILYMNVGYRYDRKDSKIRKK